MVFAGRRGRFLAALLLAEFGGAMQGIAYSTVLPVVAGDLGGFSLFGATLAAGPIAAVLMLSVAGAVLGRLRPGVVLFIATAGYVVGASMAVFAPSMEWVLAGTIVRGVAAGLLAGFGMGAIGALYDEVERPRVFGVFALIWLLPSLVGPLLNAALTTWIGWRWALAWPAVVVIVARMLMGRYVSEVPWQRADHPARAGLGLLVAGGLVLGAVGSAMSGPAALVLLATGVVVAGVGIVLFLTRGAGPGRPSRTLLAFAGVCAAFFGLYELLSLAVVEGLGERLVWASVAVMAGLTSWSLAGLKPRPGARPDAVVVGATLIFVGALGLLVALGVAGWSSGGAPALVVVVVSAAVAGLGMGLAYPLLGSEPFDLPGAPPASMVGTLVAFAETAGTAWVVLLGGGLYSAVHNSGLAPLPALLIVFGVLGLVCLAAPIAAVLRR